MKTLVKYFSLASFALLSFFLCCSLSAQTDALIVAETGNVGVGTARPNMPQIRGHVVRNMPLVPIFTGKGDSVRVAGNILLFGQPETPILFELLLGSAAGKSTRDSADYAVWRDSLHSVEGDSTAGGLVDGDDFVIWQRSGPAHKPGNASHHDNWRENQ